MTFCQALTKFGYRGRTFNSLDQLRAACEQYGIGILRMEQLPKVTSAVSVIVCDDKNADVWTIDQHGVIIQSDESVPKPKAYYILVPRLR